TFGNWYSRCNDLVNQNTSNRSFTYNCKVYRFIHSENLSVNHVQRFFKLTFFNNQTDVFSRNGIVEQNENNPVFDQCTVRIVKRLLIVPEDGTRGDDVTNTDIFNVISIQIRCNFLF